MFLFLKIRTHFWEPLLGPQEDVGEKPKVKFYTVTIQTEYTTKKGVNSTKPWEHGHSSSRQAAFILPLASIISNIKIYYLRGVMLYFMNTREGVSKYL